MNIWQKMNNAQRITIIVALVYIGLDVWLDATDQQTFSQMILELNQRSQWGWILPFIAGGLVDHFFFRQRCKREHKN